MLREEAQKTSEADGSLDQAADSPVSTAQAKPATKSTAGSRKAVTAKASTSKASPSQATPSEVPAIAPEVFASLKAELETTTQQAIDLKQQVADLKTELKTQAAASKKLQTSLDKAEQHSQQLATELTEAKQTILQLVEVNSQLKQDLQSQTVQQTIAAPPKAPPEKNPSPEPKPEAQKTPLAKAPYSQQEILQRRQQQSLAHPMFPVGDSPGHLSEQDIGWFD
jgi:chromosome segregation ATPase